MSKEKLVDEDTFSFEDLYIGGYGDEPENKAQPVANSKRYNQGKKKESQAQKKKRAKEKKAQKKKYEEGRQMSDVRLQYIEPPADGIIRFTMEDLPSVEEAWGICLVGYFDGKNPGKKALDRIISDEWKVSSRVRHYCGWIVFNFESKEDLNRVLCGGPYYGCGTKLVLKAMPEEPFALRNERPKITNEWLV